MELAVGDAPVPAKPVAALLRSWGGWTMLAISVAIYAAVSIVMHQPFHAGGLKLRYFDLLVYHLAALRLVRGTSLYGAPMLHGLGFTYPPFAALLLAPLAWLPLSVDKLTVTGLNVLLLVWTLRRALMLASPRHVSNRQMPGSLRASTWSLAASLAAAALWLEPISITLGYGQIDLLIAALVVFDLSRPDGARGKGIAVGLAAGIKLTPLLFVAYLLLSRRRRAACTAIATFALTITVSFLAISHDASAYWGGAFLNTSRVGNVAVPINQSLTGAIVRLTGAPSPASAWELLVAAIAVCGVALAARASRSGDEAAGFSLAAISTLLASPISWPHHWTLAVPALILLARRAREHRSCALRWAVVAAALLGYAYVPEIAESNFSSARGLISVPTTDPYPLVGVLVLAVCATSLVRARLHQRRLPASVRAALRLRPRIGTCDLSPGLR